MARFPLTLDLSLANPLGPLPLGKTEASFALAPTFFLLPVLARHGR